MESADRENGRSGPIFILGAMGSGTTLIRLILDSHPRIAVPQETGFGRALMAQQYIPFWLFGDQWWGRLGYSDEAFADHLRDFYSTMFRHYAEQHGKQRWGEKTPFHVWHVQRLVDLFPDAVFVAIVRHPGGNVGSLQGRFKFTIEGGIKQWSDINRELLALTEEHQDRMVLCRYEDLVLKPEATMRELLEWLGEEWSPLVLEHHAVQSERGAPTHVEGRTRSDDPIDVSRVSKWREQMSDDHYKLLRRRTGRLAPIFGYRVDEPVPAGTLTGDSDRLLMTGAQMAASVAELRATSPAVVRRPKPRLADRPLDPRTVGPSTERRRRPPGEPADQPAKAPAVKNTPRPKESNARPLARRVWSKLPQPVRDRVRRLRASWTG